MARRYKRQSDAMDQAGGSRNDTKSDIDELMKKGSSDLGAALRELNVDFK